MIKKITLVISALCLVIASAVSVGAAQTGPRTTTAEGATETGPSKVSDPEDDAQHGPSTGHLPGKRRNVKLVSRLRLTEKDGGVADVHYYKGFAYVAAWNPECPNGGTHVVDVRDPQNPVKVGFLPAGPNDYVGEGVHAIHIENRRFTGDVLLVNHEPCDVEGKAGISLWDITDPTNPWPLARHEGDFDGFGRPYANSVHSVMGFTQNGGRKAYAVLVDNDEQGSTDVDIMDISDPGQPKMIAETGLPEWEGVEVDANGENAFHHDMWYRRVNGHAVLAVSYWDAGWVFLNVDDPANPTVLYDTNYPETDLLGYAPPEGNAHQGEWSRDGEYWLGTDEDFSPFRSDFDITSGPNAGDFEGGEFGWTVPIAQNFEGDTARGTTVWGGTGCLEDVNNNGISDRDEVPDASDYDQFYEEGEERILVLTRGVCFFSIKVESGELHGWDVVLIGNSHAGSGSGEFPDAYICGSKGHEYDPTISAGCIGHRAMHQLFNDEPYYGTQPHEGSDMPPIGTVGEDAAMTSEFDGWGYLNLFDYDTGEYIDSYAPNAVLSRDKAFGFGTMSIHEIATDLRRGSNLGYVAWYSIGLRVVRWGEDGIRSVGSYRNVGGNDFWGVSLQKRGRRAPLIHMSDRDSGLWILKYTGPGANRP
ncbi:MAG: hypothetical protein M3198_00895 [Actinomycetota bacterium]|nr:hypothetical protein [Actinomycetota bacterium]